MFPLETVVCLLNGPKTARPGTKEFLSLCHGLWKFEQRSKRSFGIGVGRGREASEKYVCWTPTLGQPAGKACVEVSKVKSNQTPGKIVTNIIISHPRSCLMLIVALERGFD